MVFQLLFIEAVNHPCASLGTIRYPNFLIGFRAKAVVMWNWIWNFLFANKGARLITGSPPLKLSRKRREDDLAALESRS